MITEKIKELQAARAELAALEQSIKGDLNSELAALPTRYGFADANAFIAAVMTANGKNRRGKSGRKSVTPGETQSGKRRKRVAMTNEIRTEVKKLVNQGKTGEQIGKLVGISLSSVQNIKEAFGLVKARK